MLIPTRRITLSLSAVAVLFLTFGSSQPASAQSGPYIGQLMPVAMNFCPRGWLQADGQLQSISTNPALFSLLGTTYGGDGRTTFGLPDLRGRYAMHAGQGPGLSPRVEGQRGGAETATLTVAQIAAHNHDADTTAAFGATTVAATTNTPSQDVILAAASRTSIYGAGSVNTALKSDTIVATTEVENTGGSQGHDNMPPFLVVNWCIATTGIFPPRK